MQLRIIAIKIVASREDPFMLTAEEKFRKLMTARIVDEFAAAGLNVLERGP